VAIEAVELDQYGSLTDARLISLGGAATGEIPPPAKTAETASLVYSSRLSGSEIER
jgi:hypothetical protein